jgi:hypothetical protein
LASLFRGYESTRIVITPERLSLMATVSIPKARNTWSRATSDDEAHRRAAGRNRYNFHRRVGAHLRRQQVIELWGELNQRGGLGLYEHGAKAEIARQLGVNRSTITRDLQRIFAEWQTHPCPTCGSLVELSQLTRLEERGRVRVRL